MNNVEDLIKRAEAMQARMDAMQIAVQQMEVEGRAEGGLVVVTLSGIGALKRVSIDPSLANAAALPRLQQLLLAADASARETMVQLLAKQMDDVVGSFPVGLPDEAEDVTAARH